MKIKQPKDFSFENFAESYDNGFAAKGSRKFYNLLLREIEAQPGAALLDVGCGTGALLKLITKKHKRIWRRRGKKHDRGGTA